ncbi:DUF5672 family protein [Mucilaginibacter sp. CSA2-8R]|uniref:DUF5672 family protein n=1 Tax=Mucilaginibacter sp. CSA2-8R TaxID=3141542 RepID=UPI00315C9896
MSLKGKVAVVIPFYKPGLTAYEQVALQQCERILSNHIKIAVKPYKLALPDFADTVKIDEVINFDNHYFASIDGYNRLMLSTEFYAKFQSFEYILIHQLDAFVFKDNLLDWCSRDLDYIGAPWIRPVEHTDLIKALKSKIQYAVHTRFDVKKNGVPSEKQFENKVGNGGFSLRRVKKFYDLALQLQDKIAFYLQQQGVHEYNEDAFWSIEVNRKKKVLNIPALKVGLQFAFESSPERALKINDQQLPFGCHAWDLYADFWRPVFKQYGFEI